MSNMHRFRNLGLLIISLGLAVGAFAQNAPTAEQLQIFQNLTPEQQQAVLERMTGGSGPSGTDSTGGAEGVSGRERPLDGRLRSSTQEMDEFSSVPLMRPEDTVIVEISLAQEPKEPQAGAVAPQPASQAQQSLSLPAGADMNPAGAKPPSSESILRRNRDVVEDPRERERLQALVDLVLSRNPYTLDRNAHLNLPGFPPIALGGLTEEQATQRIAAEPVLLPLDVRIVRLPLARSGLAALKPFGYDLFKGGPSTFSPVTDVPVPQDYIIDAGDQLRVQLFGNRNSNLRLSVNRDGSVTFPELGPIRVAGLTFSEAKSTIEERVAEQLIGVRANVAMGDTRTIRIFVLGEARQPGSYTVSGFATMTAALFASGGVKPIGSLRDIRLMRQGKLVRRLDLYDLLIKGDTSGDARLQQGDVIFIPSVGPTVSIEGEVRRPAIYEVAADTRATDLLQIAGGLTPEADAARASLTRVDDQSRRVVLDADLRADGGRALVLRNGDVLRVARLRPQLDSGVVLEGFVYRPGPIAWREGLRLTDVLGSVDELRPNADAQYVLIRRELAPDRRVAVVSADLVAALSARGGADDVLLLPRDRIVVFDLAPGRERIIKPVLEELRLQSGLEHPAQVVRIEGKVKVSGEYPLELGMRVSDLLRAGGGLEAAAYGGNAELARYEVTAEGSRQTEVLEIDLAAVRRGDQQADLQLRPFDYLLIKETPNWTGQESVTLLGEVQFPGTYPIRRGETLAQVLQRAGGLTPLAFAKGSAFTRKELREREQKQLNLLAERIQSDVASLSLQAAAANQAGASQAITAGQSLLTQLRQSRAVGRLVIDLPGLLAAGPESGKDIVLRDGDTLVIPPRRPEVTVIGEVQSVSSHLFNVEYSRDDYISFSGGVTRKADAKRIFVVRADGSSVQSQSSLLRRSRTAAIQPGDTIVVPMDTERMPRLPFWQAVTQIVYNLAISVAAINSF